MSVSGMQEKEVKSQYRYDIEKYDMRNGLVQYTAYQRNWPAPVGMAWILGFSGPKKSAATLYECYTSVGARREGIMSQIIDAILRDYECVTSEGVSDCGTVFMRKTGWHYRKETGDWYKESK